jgi:hypothetical protein
MSVRKLSIEISSNTQLRFSTLKLLYTVTEEILLFRISTTSRCVLILLPMSSVPFSSLSLSTLQDA